MTLSEILELLPQDVKERLGDNIEVRPYPDGLVLAAKQTSLSVQSGKPVSLEQHSKEVTELAQSIATDLDLPSKEVIRLAAWWHDTGKADPRFQAWLQGGFAVHKELLAKEWSNVAANAYCKTAGRLSFRTST